jgi:hypothetical protein
MSIDTLRINTTNPCLILFLLDQSGSMAEEFGVNTNMTKADALADAVNETIHNIGLKCISSNGNIRDRFEIVAMGYGASNHIDSAYMGDLSDRWVVSISELFNKPLDYNEEDGAPIWINAVAGSATPMTEAFRNAYDLCRDWIDYGTHHDCHPPIIINITDGQPTDSGRNDKDLIKTIDSMRELSTDHGNIYIFNIHISDSPQDQILFPDNMDSYNDPHAKLLFNISSTLNTKMIEIGNTKGYTLSDNSRGFIFNGNSSDLVNFLNIGSSPA